VPAHAANFKLSPAAARARRARSLSVERSLAPGMILAVAAGARRGPPGWPGIMGGGGFRRPAGWPCYRPGIMGGGGFRRPGPAGPGGALTAETRADARALGADRTRL
jgi:hypothetical protein